MALGKPTTNDGAAALSVFAVLIIGWLYVTGRLQAVMQVIQSGTDVVVLPRNFAGYSGGAGGGMVGEVPTVPPPAGPPVMGGVRSSGTRNPDGSYTVTIRPKTGSGREVAVLVRPGDPTCHVTLYAAMMSQGYSSGEATELALKTCGK